MEFVIRYIKTSGNATVDHLSKYLAVRLALEEMRKNEEASPINVEAASEKQYTIYIPTANNQFTVSLVSLYPGLHSIVRQSYSNNQIVIVSKTHAFPQYDSVHFPSQVLNGSFSLELVSEKYWKVNKPMELYFAPTKEHK